MRRNQAQAAPPSFAIFPRKSIGRFARERINHA
jgi:hypothetical protein